METKAEYKTELRGVTRLVPVKARVTSIPGHDALMGWPLGTERMTLLDLIIIKLAVQVLKQAGEAWVVGDASVDGGRSGVEDGSLTYFFPPNIHFFSQVYIEKAFL